jgi:hypothetical protein
MSNITIALTDTQMKGLEYAALSPQEWAENAVTERARIAINEIVGIFVQYCLDNNMAMPTSREEMVEAAFDMGLVKTAADRQAEAEASAAQMQAGA